MPALDPSMRVRVVQARLAHLATVRPDGRPHVVPITFALVGDVVVTAVDQKPKTTLALARLANLAANSSACVLVDHYADDWSHLWWVRGDGSAEVLTAGAARDDALEHLAVKYPTYRFLPPPGPVIAIAVERWVAWSAAPHG